MLDKIDHTWARITSTTPKVICHSPLVFCSLMCRGHLIVVFTVTRHYVACVSVFAWVADIGRARFRITYSLKDLKNNLCLRAEKGALWMNCLPILRLFFLTWYYMWIPNFTSSVFWRVSLYFSKWKYQFYLVILPFSVTKTNVK